MTVIAEGYDYAVVIMIVISNHSWMESECVISAAQTSPEWLSALDDSDGGDLRYKRSAGTSADKFIRYFCRETADNLTFSAGGSYWSPRQLGDFDHSFGLISNINNIFESDSIAFVWNVTTDKHEKNVLKCLCASDALKHFANGIYFCHLEFIKNNDLV